MKKTLIILSTLLVLISCQGNETEKKAVASADVAKALTTIEWIDSAKNLGKINQGQKLQIAFRFKNSGKNPLVIQAVTPSCGCTVADFPKEPIAPGKEGEITGAFDSNNRSGLQHKEITVIANTEGNSEHKLTFEVDIQVPPAATNPQ
jgi:hypothetical protein